MRVRTLTKLQATQTIVAFLHVVKFIGYDSPYISKVSKRYGRKPWASLSMKDIEGHPPPPVPQLFVLLGSLTLFKVLV